MWGDRLMRLGQGGGGIQLSEFRTEDKGGGRGRRTGGKEGREERSKEGRKEGRRVAFYVYVMRAMRIPFVLCASRVFNVYFICSI